MEVKLRINDVEVGCERGRSLLEVAREAGFEIPSLCHHRALPAIGACRICLVELRAAGKVSLTTACNTQVEEGMEVVTDTPEIRQMRALNLELLLARAPKSQALRKLAGEYAVPRPRFPVATEGGIDNCILCELCVRACAAIGHNAINTIGRGDKKRIGLPFNKPSESCVGCGSCLSVCPTQCIFMKDTPTTRSIWGQVHNFVLCKVCRAPVITEKHRAYAIASKGLPEDYYDVCDSCKQAAASKRFASVAW